MEVLALGYLSEEPMCGKDLVERIKAKTKGKWEVSFGSVYPMLDKLEKLKVVEVSKHDRKKVYGVTLPGMEYYLNQRDKLLSEMVTSLLEQMPLLLELLRDDDSMKDVASRVLKSGGKLQTLVQAFPSDQRGGAKMRILNDLAGLLDYYTQGVKNA